MAASRGRTPPAMPRAFAARQLARPHADVAASGSCHGRRRMTLTFPTINRCRLVLWLVTGGEKAAALVRLREGDRSIPASRVRQDRSLGLADRAAAEQLGNKEKLEAQE